MIETLIALVIQLLVQAQQPNVPVQTKVDVVNTAAQVLSFAEAYQQQQQNTQGQPVNTPAMTTPPAIAPQPVLAAIAANTTQQQAPTSTPAPAPTPAPVVQAATPPSCSVQARGVVFSNDHTFHAVIGWTFTPDASVQFSAPVEYAKGLPASITQPDNTKQDSIYTTAAPNIWNVDNPTDTTYTMTVTDAGGTDQCSTTIHIPSSDSLMPVSPGNGVPFNWN
jgi:hypothetical protein